MRSALILARHEGKDFNVIGIISTESFAIFCGHHDLDGADVESASSTSADNFTSLNYFFRNFGRLCPPASVAPYWRLPAMMRLSQMHLPPCHEYTDLNRFRGRLTD